MRVLVLALLLLAPLASAAPVTRSCELVPHGYLAGANPQGCSVDGYATQSILATVSVIEGTVDAIEIEMRDPAGSTHVFLCTYEVTASTCLTRAQTTNAMDGVWTVTARVVTADPLGPLFYGGADSYARLDVTFE